MVHKCDPKCKAILAEHESRAAFKPNWNSLTHIEQAAWKIEAHASWLRRLLGQIKGFFGG